MKPQNKINVQGVSYDLIPAEVKLVDYTGTNREKLYTIRCTPLYSIGSISSSDTITARPLDSAIKKIPIAGEIVMLCIGPSAYGSAVKRTSEYYYTSTYSIQSSVHHNGIPGKSKISYEEKKKSSSKYQESEVGHKQKANESEETKIEDFFPERDDVYPLQPISGDVLIEGRFGHSIRFGSTFTEDSKFTDKPHYEKGDSKYGNPVLIIRNGQKLVEGVLPNTFINEHPDLDASSIWLSNGQKIVFSPASSVQASMINQKIDTFRTKDMPYSGNQMLGFSDRIIFNAKQSEFIAFAKAGIGFSTDGSFSVDASKEIEIDANKILLGLHSPHPAALGDITVNWLKELCINLKQLISILIVDVHLTATGPTSPTQFAPNYNAVRSNINGLEQRLEELLSHVVYLVRDRSSEANSEDKKQIEEAKRTNEDPKSGVVDVYVERGVPEDTNTNNTVIPA